MIRCDQLTKRYGSNDALLNISFQIQPGEMVFLTGHSGAGKSTLLRLIALLERPSNGNLIVHGKNLNRISKRGIPNFRRKIGMIFQDPKLLLERTVFENVALPLTIEGFRSQEISRRVRAALDKVALLHKEKSLPETLSLGEQQRVGIARAIVHRPAIILADEPTGNLDPDLSEEIINLFILLHQVGTTLFIATHDIHLIETLPYRRLILQAGQLTNDAKEHAHA